MSDTPKATCPVCDRRRAKRACPGLNSSICLDCCLESREVTIDCPHACPHLREARKHEALIKLTGDVPNQDVRVSEEFIRRQEHLVLWLGHNITRTMESSRAVDSDTREALEAVIQTYRTRESGLIYEARTANPYAAAIQEALKTAIHEWRTRMAEALGMETLRDTDILGVLVFLQRLGLQNDNGRRRGRVFYDFLLEHFPQAPSANVNRSEVEEIA